MIDSFSIGFLRTLWILRDYLHEIVVGGGWAPFLYYRYLLQNRDYEPVRTRDIDFMVKKEVPVVGNKTVDQLLIEAGFEARFNSRDTPSLVHYEGILLVSEQRPATAFTDLDDDQLKQYIYGTFGEVIQELMTFKSP